MGRWYPFRRAADNRTHVLPGVRFFVMKEIVLAKGQIALVDDEDFEWLSKMRWRANVKEHTSYVERSASKSHGHRRISMHRMIMGDPAGKSIDHVNGNGLDNRRCNLRICTTAENSRNKCIQKNNTTGFKGVSFRANRGRFTARIMHPCGKYMSLGCFDTAHDAALAYDAAAKILHKDFARLNFPK